ncbi:transposase domain-containing protein [Rhodococcus koreensis]
MSKLVQGLRFLRSWDEVWQALSSSALCQARARLGERPLRELYLRVALPLAGSGTAGGWLCELQVMAIDGVQLDVPGTTANETACGRGNSYGLDAPYPKVKVVGLGECRTDTVVGAPIGGVLVDERELARPLLSSFEPGMLVLADRGFFGREFWHEAADTGADLFWRVRPTTRSARTHSTRTSAPLSPSSRRTGPRPGAAASP